MARSAFRGKLTGSIPLAAPDLACLMADSPTRPLDYGLALHFGRSPAPPFDLESLRRGAESARQAFPVAGSRLGVGRYGAPVWIPCPGASAAPVVQTTLEDDPGPLIQDFLAPPFRLAEEPPLRQLMVGTGDPPRWSLVTHVHHAASDLVGALLFVQRQLQAAKEGALAPLPPQREPPHLRAAPRRRDRNPGFRPSTPLSTQAAPCSATRRWRTFEVARPPRFRKLSPSFDGFTWNDALLAAALEALAEWNRQQGGATARLGLWVPMNIRQERFDGFGNGASRIRVHRDASTVGSARSFVERCRAVRRAVEHKKRTGEWALPAWSPPPALARSAAPLLRRWLDRPWADFGTAGFTHLGRWPGDSDPAFAGVSRMEVVACLHRRHPLYFVAMSRAGKTAVTITWDPALLRTRDIEAITGAFSDALSERSTGYGAPVASAVPR